MQARELGCPSGAQWAVGEQGNVDLRLPGREAESLQRAEVLGSGPWQRPDLGYGGSGSELRGTPSLGREARTDPESGLHGPARAARRCHHRAHPAEPAAARRVSSPGRIRSTKVNTYYCVYIPMFCARASPAVNASDPTSATRSRIRAQSGRPPERSGYRGGGRARRGSAGDRGPLGPAPGPAPTQRTVCGRTACGRTAKAPSPRSEAPEVTCSPGQSSGSSTELSSGDVGGVTTAVLGPFSGAAGGSSGGVSGCGRPFFPRRNRTATTTTTPPKPRVPRASVVNGVVTETAADRFAPGFVGSSRTTHRYPPTGAVVATDPLDPVSVKLAPPVHWPQREGAEASSD